MKRILAVFLALLTLTLGCAMAEEAGRIIPDKTELVLPIGKTRTIKLELIPSSLKKGGVTYEISDPSVAKVSSYGKVEALSAGECTLVITSKTDASVQATIPVQVIQPVKKVTLTVPAKKLNAGETMQASYTCAPEDATFKGVTFSSSKETVATVDENGLITAVGRGGATITATSEDGAASASVKITVEQLPQQVLFKEEEYTIPVGKLLKFRMMVLPSNANDKGLVWSTSDSEIGRISQDGSIKALSAGEIYVTATSKADPSVSGSVKIRCVVPIQSISLAQASHDLLLGQTVQLVPALAPENATPAIAYSSQNSRICSVDENGLVTALRGGETTVTVYSLENKNRQAMVTVRVNVPVTGAWTAQKGMRLAVGDHVFGMVKLQPQDATNKNMTWTSSDPMVATVTNTSNRPRIVGHSWGRCELTGKTQEGGYTVSLNVNVGMLHEALVVSNVSVVDGHPFVTLHNPSDMYMTGVSLALEGEDAEGTPFNISAKYIPIDVAPGASSEPIAVPLELVDSTADITRASAAVSGWETSTGYYTNNDEIKYAYRLSPGLMSWK